VKVLEYDASRRADLADLMGRVWGRRADEREIDWFYGGNPVGPASVLLAEEDGVVVGAVAISFMRMRVAGEEVKAGMPVHLATDPAHRGRGIFATLEAANEESAREAGAKLLFVTPTPASASVLLGRLAWTALPSLRVWARLRPLRRRLDPRTRQGGPLSPQVTNCYLEGSGDRVLRDEAWLNWRFGAGPRRYRLLERDGYAVVGRRGRIAFVAAVEGDLLGDAAAAAAAVGGRALMAAPPPWEHGRYARAGYVPTPRTIALLGRSLDPATPLPARPHFQLGDLDFF
jgi:GNAT superfamily N-acetyltransferase